MCSPIGDGAAVLVFCAPEFARARGLDAVRVATITLVSGQPGGASCNSRAAAKAYAAAGVGPEEIDVVELHDAASIGEHIASFSGSMMVRPARISSKVMPP